MIHINMLAYKIIWYDGYGRFFSALVRSLVESGKVDVRPDTIDRLEYPGWMQRLMGLDYTKLTLSIMPGHEFKPLPGRQWAMSMYESTGLPRGWGDNINAHAERLLVPCQWAAEVFKENGVKLPIHVVHGGTDPAENPIIPAYPNGHRPYTFVALGDRGVRKGWDTVWTAFSRAFSAQDDVRLLIKCRGFDLRFIDNTGSPDPMTRKVHIWREDVASMRDVFAQADCVVYPATADGWGMFPREGACAGLPVIATDYSGVSVGLEHWGYPLKQYREVNAMLPSPREPGKWARPDIDEVAHWMRYCYDHPVAAKQKGLEAAAWIRQNQTWQHSAAQLIDLLEHYG